MKQNSPVTIKYYNANIINLPNELKYQTLIKGPKTKIPKNKKATYVQIVCAIRPNKTEKYCVRLTAGKNLVHYEGEKSTPIALLETIKIH